MPYDTESTELISQLRSELAQRDDQIKSLHAIVELRERELAKAKKDRERLDWLELHLAQVKDSPDWRKFYSLVDNYETETARQAIDAAMQSETSGNQTQQGQPLR